MPGCPGLGPSQLQADMRPPSGAPSPTSSWMVRISPSGRAPCSARHCAICFWYLFRRWMRSFIKSLAKSGERAAGVVGPGGGHYLARRSLLDLAQGAGRKVALVHVAGPS